MSLAELKAIVEPLSLEERQQLRGLLDDAPRVHSTQQWSDAAYRIGELARGAEQPSNAPADFAENHDRYVRGQNFDG